MSNEGTENLIEHIIDEVDTLWQLPNRDDLKSDCIQYVFDNWEDGFKYDDEIYLVIQFLSMKCADVMSEADLESMARAEEESKVSSYQEADQGV